MVHAGRGDRERSCSTGRSARAIRRARSTGKRLWLQHRHARATSDDRRSAATRSFACPARQAARASRSSTRHGDLGTAERSSARPRAIVASGCGARARRPHATATARSSRAMLLAARRRARRGSRSSATTRPSSRRRSRAGLDARSARRLGRPRADARRPHDRAARPRRGRRPARRRGARSGRSRSSSRAVADAAATGRTPTSRPACASRRRCPDGAVWLGLVGHRSGGSCCRVGDRVAVALPGPPARAAGAVAAASARRTPMQRRARAGASRRAGACCGCSASPSRRSRRRSRMRAATATASTSTICAREFEIHVDLFVRARARTRAPTSSSGVRGRRSASTSSRRDERVDRGARRSICCRDARPDARDRRVVHRRARRRAAHRRCPARAMSSSARVVAYADAVKRERLGVPARRARPSTAPSRPRRRAAMAAGARKRARRRRRRLGHRRRRPGRRHRREARRARVPAMRSGPDGELARRLDFPGDRADDPGCAPRWRRCTSCADSSRSRDDTARGRR